MICSLHIVLCQNPRAVYNQSLLNIFQEKRTFCHNKNIPTLSRYTNSIGIEWSIELKEEINIFFD